MARNIALMREATQGKRITGAYTYIRRAMYEEDGEVILAELKESLSAEDYADALVEHEALVKALDGE